MEAVEQAFSGAPAAAPARADVSGAHASLIVSLFASAMFLSGFLLFIVEPMAARMVLPVLGGVPMVWNGCVVFFQIVMLAGYGYAYGASRWVPLRHHVILHALLLALPATVLPVMISTGSVPPPDGNPLGWLLLVLAGSIGLPFFVLSTSASVFQHWLSRTDHPSAGDPYFLYSASNLGCLLALAAYPAVVEPIFTLREQTRLWTIGYVLLVVLAATCAVFAWRRTVDGAAVTPVRGVIPAAPIAGWRRARWVALAFVPSSLMLAVTSHISTDIAAVPLLWIVPLALYLLTFVVAFGRHSAHAGALARRALPLVVVPLALFMIVKLRTPLPAIVLLHLVAFAVVALSCHADLAEDRPEASRLTEFYFWVSLGGMLGGLFNTLAAPVLFDSVVEYPLVVIAACLMARGSGSREAPRTPRAHFGIPVAVAVITAGTLVAANARDASLALRVVALSVPAVLTFAQRRKSVRFGLCMAALIGAGVIFESGTGRVLYATRTFFGVYRVNENATGQYHQLVHGTTLHGMQSLAPARRGEALTYYHATGPFGQAWHGLARASSGRDIAVVGLGVGTLATYAGAEQRWTFFEIDPAIERIARNPAYFSFLEACGPRCRVISGDARVSLGRAPAHGYDLLVLDAFSSDSIPIHLMTREALSLYLSRLGPGGAIVMHVSNRHLRLAPVAAQLAASHQLVALQQLESAAAGWPEGKNVSQWIVMARTPADLGTLTTDRRWSPLAADASTALWTDDFSNILGALRVR